MGENGNHGIVKLGWKDEGSQAGCLMYSPGNLTMKIINIAYERLYKPPKKGGLPRQVESSSFGAFFASMVISNSILIGVSLEAQAVQGDNFAGAEENCGKTKVISPYFTKVPYQTGLFEAGQLVQTEFVPVHFGPK